MKCIFCNKYIRKKDNHYLYVADLKKDDNGKYICDDCCSLLADRLTTEMNRIIYKNSKLCKLCLMPTPMDYCCSCEKLFLRMSKEELLNKSPDITFTRGIHREVMRLIQKHFK